MVRLKGVAPTLLTYCTLIIFLYFLVVKPLLPRIHDHIDSMDTSSVSTVPPDDMLDQLDIDCQAVLNGTRPYKRLQINSTRIIEDKLLYSKNRCETLKSLFHFNDAPFPKRNPNSLWHTKRPPIRWGSHEIINSAYECLEFLSHLKTEWKYFQYLSGVDAPLKTNLETVRILKELKGTANIEIKNYQNQRLRGKNYTQAPLPLFKSSLSALIPREAANELASSLVPRDLLEFLENTGIADEGFWGTLFGNRERFNIPGAMEFKDWLAFRDSRNVTWPLDGSRYYISRDQIWSKAQCHNYMTAGSCVFGIGDVPRLIKSMALIGHKFYLKSEPEAYFCILKEIRRRTFSPDPLFNTTKYSELPQVELAREQCPLSLGMSGAAADGIDDRDIPKKELHEAAFNGDIEKIEYLIREKKVHVDSLDDDHVTILHIAAAMGNNKLVVRLLDLGANINATNQLGMTAYHYAAREGKLPVIDTLLQRGAAKNMKTRLGVTALTLACAGGHADVVRRLIRLPNENPRSETMTKRSLAPTPLIVATCCKSPLICGYLAE
uniref:ANK_REP_REGION domain-containing protein n=1 Tax=Caenorhabditis tropicalis TaxID=1561998 RepID=A0A1I7UJI7_9PELO